MPTFRQFVMRVWFEHLDELMAWGQSVPNYTSEEYFKKYRWWLRREYRSFCKVDQQR
jgi:hypothetical protein